MKWLVVHLVYFYQRYISPAFPPSCRYQPTCSNYMLQAVEKHGGIKGTVMGIARIFRCHPLVRGGKDEVPEQFSIRRNSQ